MSRDWQTHVDAHRAQVRQDIISAALALVSQQGVVATTMSQLALRAGISRATLYKYFADVPQVLMAWVLDEVDRAVNHLETELAKVDAPLDRLELFVSGLLRTWAGADHRFGVEQLSASLPPEVMEQMDAQMDRLRAVLTEILAAGVAEGSLRPDVDPELYGQLMMQMLSSLRGTVLESDRTVDEMAAVVCRLFCDGLAA